MPHDSQMLKGVLSLLLLSLLGVQEDYGYGIVLRLRAMGFTDLGEGTVYPALSRLEAAGELASRLVASDAGPARKYYHITAAGRSQVATRRIAWQRLVDAVATVLAETDQDPGLRQEER